MRVTEEDLHSLFEEALAAAKNSYSPYSHFPVGAALLLPDGKTVRGANVENRSFGLTNCAERTALFTAVAAGYRTFLAAAVAAPESATPVGPCGACRQALTEFAPACTPVIFGSRYENCVVRTLGELYPFDSLHELADQQTVSNKKEC